MTRSRHQQAPISVKAQDFLQSENLTELTDSGYYECNQLKSCEDPNAPVYVAIPDESKAVAAKGRLTREQFSYAPEQNTYRCPQGKLLTASGKAHQKNRD